jgi:hypothetical protein
LADWHPILAMHEDAAGFWRMVARYDRPYGTVRLIRRGGEIGYRADNIPAPGVDGVLVGNSRTLQAAAVAIHQAELANSTTAGGPNAPRWPTRM